MDLPGLGIERLRVARNGGFQRDNAAVALAASWSLASGEGIGRRRLRRGGGEGGPRLAMARPMVPASAPEERRCWVDGGHNPEAASALAREIPGFPASAGKRRGSPYGACFPTRTPRGTCGISDGTSTAS